MLPMDIKEVTKVYRRPFVNKKGEVTWRDVKVKYFTKGFRRGPKIKTITLIKREIKELNEDSLVKILNFITQLNIKNIQ